MKYEKLIYIYPYSIGSFLNCKAGIEATLEEGDNIDECWDKIRSDVKRLVAKEQGVQDDSQFANQEVLSFEREKGFPTAYKIGHTFLGVPTEDDIALCGSLEQLEQALFPAIDRLKDEEKKRQLWLIYDKRYGELKTIQP